MHFLSGTSDQSIPSLLSNFSNEEVESRIQNIEKTKSQSFSTEENEGHKKDSTENLDSSEVDPIQLENSQTKPSSDKSIKNDNNEENRKSLTGANVTQDHEKNDDDIDDDIEIIDSGHLQFDDTDQISEYDVTVQTLSESYKDQNRKVISFFDFAGQFAYYACHHIYFSPNNFYILVMDITKKLDDVVHNDSTMSDQTGAPEFSTETTDKLKGTMYSKWTHLGNGFIKLYM
jgi:hypothetical protein